MFLLIPCCCCCSIWVVFLDGSLAQGAKGGGQQPAPLNRAARAPAVSPPQPRLLEPSQLPPKINTSRNSSCRHPPAWGAGWGGIAGGVVLELGVFSQAWDEGRAMAAVGFGLRMEEDAGCGAGGRGSAPGPHRGWCPALSLPRPTSVLFLAAAVSRGGGGWWGWGCGGLAAVRSGA